MRLSFRARLLLIAGAAVVLAVGSSVTVGALLTYQTRQEQARLSGRAQAVALAEEIAAHGDQAMTVARTLAHVVHGYLAALPPAQRQRPVIEAMLRRTLAEHPEFVGVYVGFEAGGFDAGGERFLPYCNRGADGAVAIKPLAGMEDASPGPSGLRQGEYWLRPKETGHECLIDPYPYTVQGREVWMTSAVVPLMVDGAFVGIAGVDITLAEVAEHLARGADAAHALGLVVSPHGLLAATHGLEVPAGAHIRAVHGDDWQENLAAVAKGAFVADDASAAGRMEVYAPFSVGRDPAVWAVNLLMDVGAFTHEAQATAALQAGVGAIAALFAMAMA